jgi:hypothetical protein
VVRKEAAPGTGPETPLKTGSFDTKIRTLYAETGAFSTKIGSFYTEIGSFYIVFRTKDWANLLQTKENAQTGCENRQKLSVRGIISAFLRD